MGFKASPKVVSRGLKTNPTGIIGNFANPALGPFQNLLFGKKSDAYGGSREIDLEPDLEKTVNLGRDVQRLGLGDIIKDYETPAEGIAQAQVERESKFLDAGKEDSRRRLSEILSQRGLQGTSMGLTQLMGLDKDLAEKKQTLFASLPERIRQMRLERAQNAIGQAGNVLSNVGERPGLEYARDVGRGGGLLGFTGLTSQLSGNLASILGGTNKPSREGEHSKSQRGSG